MPKRNSRKRSKKSRVPRSIPVGNLLIHTKEYSAVATTTTSASGLFELTQVALNVRSSNLGLLIAALGAQYEKWRIHSIRCQFRSWLPTTVGGASAMAYFPDPTLTPTTWAEMIGSENSLQKRPWDSFQLKCRVSKQWFFCALKNTEQRLSDIGSVCHATQAYASALEPGNINFELVIEFAGPLE
jgi:hypothetical protein